MLLIRRVVHWLSLGLLLAGAAVAGAEDSSRTVRETFLKMCDVAVHELHKPLTPFLNRTNADPASHHMPFFEDAHAVRALVVAYDLTTNRAYLDTCRRWSDRMIDYQRRMLPAGAYYMNHGRTPGEDKGQWNVADNGSIAMAILATSARCPSESKERYLRSVQKFAALVLSNYTGTNGAFSNGLWPQYAGEWWCSTATFGALLFHLYDETRDERYMRAARGGLQWLVSQDFRKLQPITFEQRPSGTIFYLFDFYLAGLKHLPRGSREREQIAAQFHEALDWMARNQKTRGAPIPDYLERNVDMAGLPSLMFGFARELPDFQQAIAPAEKELAYIGELLFKDGQPSASKLMVWEVLTWGMVSYAERLQPPISP